MPSIRELTGSQPPIWLIDRSGRTKSTWPIRCPAHFVATAPSIASREPVVEIGFVETAPGAQHDAQIGLVEREQARSELRLRR